MKETKQGSEDGTIVKTFEKNKVYTISDELGKVFLDEKWAMKVAARNKETFKTPEKPGKKAGK